MACHAVEPTLLVVAIHGAQAALDGLDGLVARQQAVCQAQIERFDRLAAETDDEFRCCVLEFRRGQLGAVVRWLDRCLEIL